MKVRIVTRKEIDEDEKKTGMTHLSAEYWCNNLDKISAKNRAAGLKAAATRKRNKGKAGQNKLIRYVDIFDGIKHRIFLCEFCNKQYKNDTFGISCYRKHLAMKHRGFKN